ncbi:uncharacterized protein LOC142344235 [Convolutriloba macropyga]|uniref:uncharacterized protein LOC142344235 n=1 Tax=Convolutriloba macropyga TaxID=536237 RepID=UPI003F529089
MDRPSNRSLFIAAQVMVFISFFFASFAHANYGWVEESAHGGIWQACFQYFGCVSVESSKLKVARAFFILDLFVVILLGSVLGSLVRKVEMLLFVKKEWLLPGAAIISIVHLLFIMIACAAMTHEFNSANVTLSWGTFVPWLGFVLSFFTMIGLVVVAAIERRLIPGVEPKGENS